MPQSKLHLKLLQATKVIIALVKEKKQLAAQLEKVTAGGYDQKTSHSVKPSGSSGGATVSPLVQQCDKSVQATTSSPRGHVQWTFQKPKEYSVEQRAAQPESSPSSTCKSEEIATSSGNGHKPEEQDQAHVYQQQSGHSRVKSHSPQQSGHGRVKGHSPPPVSPQLDMSLASLKFTDSSLGESSLHHVLQMVERELSSSDNEREAPLGHSTPEPAPVHVQQESAHQPLHQQGKENRSLKLVGSRVVPQVKRHGRPQAVVQTNKSTTQKSNRSTVKPRVRNYNIRD